MHPGSKSETTPRFTLDLFQPSTGFLAAMKVARQLPFQNILIVACEVLTPFLNLRDVGTAMLFGDAAIAALFTKTKTEKTLFKVEGEVFYATPDFSHVLRYDDGVDSFHMKGPELFRKIVPEFKRVSKQILNELELTVEQIQYYLPHQANLRLIERVAHNLGFEPAQLITNIQKVGNTSSASMGLALVDFLNEDVISSGNRILLNACGAGLTSGAAVMQKI
jgi:3-oxoacyl-[acyl-carrier-protein] synthase-3